MKKAPSTTKSAGPRIGIDLGGTKIEAVILDAEGTISTRLRKPTPTGDYNETLAVVDQLVRELMDNLIEQQGVSAADAANIPVGIGTPGSVSFATGLMKNCNSTCINGRALREDLQQRLQRPVRIANDADCFALSEASDGAAADAHSVFGVILGTGVGGGLVYRGQPLSGVNGICGEWGHNTLPLAAYQPTSPETLALPIARQRHCYCGRDDCVENWLAGPALQRSYLEMTGEAINARAIAAKIDAGDPQAVALFQRYCNLLALALSTVINIVDPAVIVMGGGLSNLAGLYDQVPEYLPRYVFSDHVSTRIVQAQHGDSSGVRGAAWLWP
jgi:predicted NBD/HSP70 family sugar kinase